MLLLAQSPVFAFLRIQDDVQEKIEQAERLFDEGKIDESINILELVLDERELTIDQKQKAYELLAANYLAKMYEERADRALRKLLELVPNYRPDPTYYSRAFIDRVESVRKELAAAQPPKDTTPPAKETAQPPKDAAQPPRDEEKDSFIGSTWFWVGAGVLVAGAATAFAISGGNGATSQTQAQPLPSPPDLP
ncbi:MAG: hypothetical protein WBD30_07960 [Bacteroidota bacterium]